jgi:hypothetical protein
MFLFISDGKVMDFPPLAPKDCVAALMAQMSAAAAAAATSVGLPQNMIPPASEMVQQAMWITRAQRLIEEQQQRNIALQENSSANSTPLVRLRESETSDFKLSVIGKFLFWQMHNNINYIF